LDWPLADEQLVDMSASSESLFMGQNTNIEVDHLQSKVRQTDAMNQSNIN